MDTAAPQETNASPEQLSARARLQQVFSETPIPSGDLMSNLGLFMRSSLLAKFLVINDLYRRILSVPGAIVEFGVWWGQNLVLFENLRAIYEPFNKTRKIVGFDTFEGYRGFSERDGHSPIFQEETYSVSKKYASYLKDLLALHEANNVLGHVSGGHELVTGDVTQTAAEFLQRNPGLTVALAYFDMGLYGPTYAALQAIKPRLVPGSVILLDEFSWAEAPGEAQAFRDVFANGYRIEKCALTPMRAIVTIT